MTGERFGFWQALPRLLIAACLAFAVVLPPTTVSVSAAAGDRTLTFYHTHTQKTGTFTFKRNGKFDPGVLKELNIFLADWRNKESTRMDPALFDLLWQIYQEVGGKQPIHIVSSYRSPKTNAMLRAKSSGVAENSQHIRGQAMDIYIPGVNLSRLREAAMRYQVGGVGYYPTSGSPFVHVDTGSVRAWPRMTRAQLQKIFPDGKTLHLPTDGKPLSDSGRAYAQAQWTKCHAVPCNGQVVFDNNPGIMVADANGAISAPIPAVRPASLSAGDQPTVMMAALQEPTQRSVSTIEITAPIPLARPQPMTMAALTGTAGLDSTSGAPIPAVKSPRIKLATRAPLGSDTGENALTALAALEQPLPKPRVLMTPKPDMVTAYVSTEPDPGAQRALQMIIERETTAALPKLSKKELPVPVRLTASLGGGNAGAKPAADPMQGMFELTFASLSEAAAPKSMADALARLALSRQASLNLPQREIELTAPELDHVNDTLVEPVPMITGFWAVMSEAEGYLEKTTELGAYMSKLPMLPHDAAVPEYDRFVLTAPQLLAERG